MILRTATKVLHHSMLHGAWKDTLLAGHSGPEAPPASLLRWLWRHGQAWCLRLR